jgi:hypothetical protein
MSTPTSTARPFVVKDCALAVLATGQRAQSLRELRDRLDVISPDSVYHHFWGRLLRPAFENPEFVNDFAAWAHHGLRDEPLAERLAVIDPTEFEDLEALRQELIDVIEARLDEHEAPAWAPRDRQFHFMSSQIVVFDTHQRLATPEALAAAVSGMSLGSVFYHFIDARRRTPDGRDDLRVWLEGFGPDLAPLSDALAGVDPYFSPLSRTRDVLAEVVAARLPREAS